MIKSFKDKVLERCWRLGQCKGVGLMLRRRVLMKLDSMDAASHLDDLKNPPGNRLYELKGNYRGYHAISVNGPWRLIFKVENNDIFDVMLVQYH